MTFGVRVLRLDRFGQPEQRLAVRDLQLLVALLELLGALLDDRIEQRLAAMELGLLERELAHELALLFDQREQLHALVDECDQPAAFARPRDEADDRAGMRRTVIEIDRFIRRADERDAKRFGRVQDARFEQAHAIERAGHLLRDDHVRGMRAELVQRLERGARGLDVKARRT